MDKKNAIRFAGLMEDYLNIPSFVCEYIEKALMEERYENDYLHISFEKQDKAFIKTYGDDNSPEIIDMQELKAINQQCKELGWNK